MELFTHPTLDQLHQLGLAGMARAFAELEANPTSAALSHAEWLGLLLDREITERYEKRLRARLRFARLRHQAAVEDRYGRGATLITSQIPVDRWHALIGDSTLADAILDRVIHNAHRLQLSGDSLRKQKAPQTVAA